MTGRWPRGVRSPTLHSGLDSDQPSAILLDHLVTFARAVLEFLVVEDLDLAAGDAVARLTTNIKPLV